MNSAIFNRLILNLPQLRDLLSRHTLAVLSICALLATMIGGAFITFGTTEMTGQGNLFRQLSYILIFLVAALSANPLSKPQALLAVPPMIAATLLWCWLSLAWSAVPGIAFRRIILTSAVIWAIAISVRMLGYRECLKILRRALVLTLVANYIAVIFFPEFGIHQTSDMVDTALFGNWKGVVQHKNFAGALSALTILLYVFDRFQGNIIIRSAIVTSAALFLMYSHSKTSEAMLLICLLLGSIARFYEPRFFKYVAAGAGLVLMLGLLSLSWLMRPLVEIYQDPSSFTGRSQIWQMLVRYIGDHPLLGSGYGSFWNAGPSSPVYVYATGWIQRLASGHNGYLDMAAQIGVGGAIAATIAFIILPISTVLTASHFSRTDRALFLSALVFCAGHNVTEASLLDRDNFVHVFLTMFVLMVYQPPWKRKSSNMPDQSAQL